MARTIKLALPDVPVHRMASADAASSFPDGSVDLVFIDADHTYDGCLADIRPLRRPIFQDNQRCSDIVARGLFSEVYPTP